MAKNSGSASDFKQPYLALRRNIGLLAILLPIIVWAGGWILPPHDPIRSSISAYYHSEMRNWFVGILFATGVFLLTYNPRSHTKGYAAKDQYFGIAAGIFAIAVAFFPTARTDWEQILPRAAYNEGFFGIIHLIAATFLFAVLIVFSYFLFTETGRGKKIGRGSRKEKRNRVYKASAYVMSACVIAIAAYYLTGEFGSVRPDLLGSTVFFAEFVAIEAFGVAWFTKGEGLERLSQGVRGAGKLSGRLVTSVRKKLNLS